ncbi:hypothetical protein TNCV_2340361 [Trichonephila clavipes]|nr:hypothetical protein TNCV_2340361 [Trichonephila clavipes]
MRTTTSEMIPTHRISTPRQKEDYQLQTCVRFLLHSGSSVALGYTFAPLLSCQRAIGDGPHHFEPRSSDEDES